jgi:glucosamine--fructose-6-phosphate aminotransferase (isomerizing)
MEETCAGHIMLQEIREQPAAITRLIAAERERVWQMSTRWHQAPPRFIVLAARGTSDHAALYAKYLFEIQNGIPVVLAAPSVAGIYRARVKMDGGLVIGISQSGKAADVIAVLKQAREEGADTLAITNVATSPLADAADHLIELHAAPEVAVAATKTFSSTMAALLLLSAAMSRSQHLSAGLERLPALLEDVLRHEEAIRAKVERFRYLTDCVLLGRGYNMATAYELGLKLRETCYLRALPFATPDFVHGPIAILEEGLPVFAIANQGPTFPSVLDVIVQSKARGAEVMVIGNAEEALQMADIAFPINRGQEVPEELSPFPTIVAGQLLAQRLSVLKGIDPDQPRGLNKVTITR